MNNNDDDGDDDGNDSQRTITHKIHQRPNLIRIGQNCFETEFFVCINTIEIAYFRAFIFSFLERVFIGVETLAVKF